jgi:hypothetical protein
MKKLGVWLQLVSHWLVVWLISTWGGTGVLLATLALTASTAPYLASTGDKQAQSRAAVSRTLPSLAVQCSRSVPVVAYRRVAAGLDPLSCASAH